MNKGHVITMLSEEFENDKTGEKVEGITIIIDGKFKQVLDLIKSKDENYKDYTEVLRDALIDGVNNLVSKKNMK